MFQVSSQSGRILPLEAVASFCEEHNIVVVVDGTQSCQLLLSAQKKQILDRVDFFVMSTHKWIGNVKTCGLIRLISILNTSCSPYSFSNQVQKSWINSLSSGHIFWLGTIHV